MCLCMHVCVRVFLCMCVCVCEDPLISISLKERIINVYTEVTSA